MYLTKIKPGEINIFHTLHSYGESSRMGLAELLKFFFCGINLPNRKYTTPEAANGFKSYVKA